MKHIFTQKNKFIPVGTALALCCLCCLSACAPKEAPADGQVSLQTAATVSATPVPMTALTPAPTPEAVIMSVEAEKRATATPAPTPSPTPTASPTPTPTPTPAPTPDPFAGSERTVHEADGRFFYIPLTEGLIDRITGMSYPEDASTCRIGYEELRYVRVMYIDYEGNEQEGELVVNYQVAEDVMRIFYELYAASYQLCSVRLVDDYGEPGDDNISMAANNSSAFNYRRVSGSKKLSWHSYGCAVDINPVENPYINGKKVSPPAGKEYTNRKDKRPHMIDHGDLAYTVFRSYGWKWGGDFSGDKDYQHFYKELNYQR